MPAYVQENDLIVLGLHRSDAITSGLNDYTMRVDQPNDNTSGTNRFSTVYTRKAGSIGPENLTIVQGPVTTRLGGILVILRPKPGYEVTIENSAVGTYYAATTPGLHPIPAVTALGNGRMAYVLSTCTYAAASGNTSYSVASPYRQTSTASLAQNRLCVAVLPLNSGQSTTDVVSVCSHDNAALHDGAEIAIIFTATAL